MNPLDLVKAQHEYFGLEYNGGPRHLSTEEKRFRVCCLMEEVTEYLMADTLHKEYDAILDLLVFALGTLARQGLPLDGIQEVIDANMKKLLGPNEKRNGFELDLVKPQGWKAADLTKYI